MRHDPCQRGAVELTRFLASLSIAMGTLYLLYFLRDAVHYARLFPGQTAADGLLTAS